MRTRECKNWKSFFSPRDTYTSNQMLASKLAIARLSSRPRLAGHRSITSSIRDIISSLAGSASSSLPPTLTSSASVPFVIPRASKLHLNSELDWSASEIKAMTPILAKAILDFDVRRPEKLGDFTRDDIERLVEAIAVEDEGGDSREVDNAIREELMGQHEGHDEVHRDDDAMWEVVTTDDKGKETMRGLFSDPDEADFVAAFHGKRGRTSFKRRRRTIT